MPDKVIVEESGPSKDAHDHVNWEPDWVIQRFAGFLQCSNKDCRDVASISGNTPVNIYEYQDEYEHHQTISDLYVVKSIFPAPIPIEVPEAVPQDIKEAVEGASALVWASNEAAGNQLRQVVELFLTHEGIPEKAANGNYLTAHNRIQQFQKIDSENGDALLAVKWLGNSSSHPGGLTRDDVLDAFDMIEFVFENRYATKKADLKAKIASILAAKGPPKKGKP
ncbi:MAG: DUF4145 domain-containing protein [Sphingomonas sp.]|nr:DUF4145 domain-containing protein [Sphingomonas sp.]